MTSTFLKTVSAFANYGTGEVLFGVDDSETHDHCSVLEQYDAALALYRRYYQYDKVEGATRKTYELVPESAFGETLANASVSGKGRGTRYAATR